MEIPFFDSHRIHFPYKDQLSSNILTALEVGNYIQGKEVKLLEERLAHFLKVKHCISCANGSDALTIALSSLELPVNSEVIIPSFNYVSAAESCVNIGLKPVFCDVSLNNFNTNLSFIKEKINSNTKAIVVTHLFGIGIQEIKEIAEFCDQNNLYLIEDNAQSFGAAVKNNMLGSYGDVSTTSFFPTKNLGGLGDGGAIFTNNSDLAHKIKMLCNHGQSEKYQFEIPGYNSRLDTLQAAALLVKLEHLESDFNLRKNNALEYLGALKDIPNIALPDLENHTFNQFSIKIKDRDNASIFLKNKGIANMTYYPLPLHKQKCFKTSNSAFLPNSEQLCKEVLSLPIFPGLKSVEISYICTALKEFCE